MKFIIPTPTTKRPLIQQVELEGTLYDFSFRFNPREEVWYLKSGAAPWRKMVNGIDLLKSFHYLAGVPPGELVVEDQNGLDQDAGETLGDRVILTYTES